MRAPPRPTPQRSILFWPTAALGPMHGCLLIFAATLAAYGPSLRAGFVWNDSDYVTRPELRSFAGLARIWTELGATEQYYPLLHSAFWLQHALWGDSAIGYHLINILLHAGAACLLACVVEHLRGRTGSSGAGWIAGLAFAVHPVAVESVAWISEEKNTLSTVFYLLAALLYLRALGEDRPSSDSRPSLNGTEYAFATLSFICALLSKGVTGTLPAALLVIIWWKRGSLGWRGDVFPLLPWFALGAAGGLFTGWVERTYIIASKASEFVLGFLSRCLVAGRVVWFYAGKLAWPHPLIFFYPRWHVDPRVPFQWLYPLGAVAVFAALWSIRRRTRTPLAAALLFVGTLFPVLGFLDVYAFRFSFVADHFQYLAMIGPLALVAVALPESLAGVPRSLYVLPVLAGWTVLTWSQCGNYRGLETFYTSILAKNPDSWIAHNNFGSYLVEHGRDDEAIGQYRAALTSRPRYPEAENNLGVLLDRGGQTEAAIAHYRTAAQLDPTYVDAYCNLGEALAAAGRMEESVRVFEQALHLRPGRSEALNRLGPTLYALGRPAEALPYYEAAVVAHPRDPAVLNNLGGLLMATHHFPEAAQRFRESIKLKADWPQSQENLGMVLMMQGRFGEAISALQKAASLDPSNPRVQQELQAAVAGGRNADNPR